MLSGRPSVEVRWFVGAIDITASRAVLRQILISPARCGTFYTAYVIALGKLLPPDTGKARR